MKFQKYLVIPTAYCALAMFILLAYPPAQVVRLYRWQKSRRLRVSALN